MSAMQEVQQQSQAQPIREMTEAELAEMPADQQPVFLI